MTRTRLAALCCFALCCLGCTTGPTATQNRAGLQSTNSPLNKVMQTDDQGTITSEVAGTTDWIRQDSGSTLAHSTGQVKTVLSAERPDGARLTLNSGKDSEGSIACDPATGNPTLITWKASASAPLTALGDLQAKYADVFNHLSDNQRAAVQASLDAIKTVAPDLFSLIAKALGVP